MPIDYSEYHPKWSLISRLIRYVRAKNKCERCGIPNGIIILKKTRESPNRALWDLYNDLIKRSYSVVQARKIMGFTKIILTVAHLDHDKKNNRFCNLAALCQRCHLKHDKVQHADNRKYGRKHKTNNLKLDL